MKVNKLNIECNSIYAVGDIHGVFNSVVSMMKRYNITNSIVICCGDCGLGFNSVDGTKTLLNKLNKECKQRNVHIVMFRGNHDDPSFFNNPFIGSEYIHPVPDYTVLNDSILLVGGATSIDRVYRMQLKEQAVKKYMLYHPGKTEDEAKLNTTNYYWPDEAPVFDAEALNDIAEQHISIKHVCTHTCPSFCDPQSKDGIKEWGKYDSELFSVIDNERNVMDSILNELKQQGQPIDTWTYGHYHRHHSDVIDGIKFTMLDAVLSDGDYPDWIEIKNN